MKPSFYNYSLQLFEGGRLYFNFYTLVMVVLDRIDAVKADRILKDPDTFSGKAGYKRITQLLQKKGFLITKGIDERKVLSKLFELQQRDDTSLSVTIAPTLNCNFKCVYCYETPVQKAMNRGVEEKVIRFVQNKLGGKKQLSITWFGGEPLLKPKIIDRLSAAFLRLCKQHDTEYSASIITNGYLLDQKMVDMMKRNSIDLAQVTLDGPGEVQNARRPHHTDPDGFETIVRNLENAIGQVDISLRMNVDSRNEEYILPLLEMLQSRGLDRHIQFYLGQAYPYTEACQSVAGHCLSDQHFSMIDLNLGLKMIEMGINGYRQPTSKNAYCMADRLNSYAFGPDGAITKCWNMISDQPPLLGYLNGTATDKSFGAHNFHHRDPFSEACMDCTLLPVCMGGCPYLYHREGKLKCHSWKHHLDEHLMLYYIFQKRKQELEVSQRFQSLVEKIQALS